MYARAPNANRKQRRNSSLIQSNMPKNSMPEKSHASISFYKLTLSTEEDTFSPCQIHPYFHVTLPNNRNSSPFHHSSSLWWPNRGTLVVLDVLLPPAHHSLR